MARRPLPLAARSAALALLLALAPIGSAAAAEERSPSVGMTGRLEDVVLPGPELEPKPLAPEDPIVLRVVACRPHGAGFRYDLEFTGLEPGPHDLRDYLRRRDGSKASLDSELPPLPVEVRQVLPADQLQPHPLTAAALPRLGGYRATLIALGVLWAAGVIGLLWVGRSRRRRAAPAAPSAPPTLRDRLRPLVDRAVRGELEPGEQAALELLLLDAWRARLGLAALSRGEALARLRAHPEAGDLLRQVEAWLHQPPGRGGAVDVATLLAPYADPAFGEPAEERP